VTGVERADPATVRKTKFVVSGDVDTHGGHKARQFRREMSEAKT
jgi:hypothetical protein